MGIFKRSSASTRNSGRQLHIRTASVPERRRDMIFYRGILSASTRNSGRQLHIRTASVPERSRDMIFNRGILSASTRNIVFACLLLAAAVAASALQPEAQAKAEKEFTPRLTAPAESDDNYALYTSKNIFYTSGYGMPNCTCYAYGRAYEILKSEPKLCLNDAGEWYEYNKSNGCYPYGQQPKEGAIACWQNGDGGHVAVVEAIDGDKIIMSQSGWEYLYFYVTEEDCHRPGQKGWEFLGYIYI